MTQADRDRLVTLKKAKKKLITQREAAEELGLSTRQVKRLLYALKKRGDMPEPASESFDAGKPPFSRARQIAGCSPALDARYSTQALTSRSPRSGPSPPLPPLTPPSIIALL